LEECSKNLKAGTDYSHQQNGKNLYLNKIKRKKWKGEKLLVLEAILFHMLITDPDPFEEDHQSICN